MLLLVIMQMTDFIKIINEQTTITAGTNDAIKLTIYELKSFISLTSKNVSVINHNNISASVAVQITNIFLLIPLHFPKTNQIIIDVA